MASKQSNVQTSEAVPMGQLPEASKDKFFRKMREQPLVPIGSLLTCGALIVASNQLRKGNREQFQKALRWRVGLQGLTLVAALAGSYYYNQAVKQPPILSSTTPATQPQQQEGEVLTHPSGRPVTKWQQMRSEERTQKQKSGFDQRLANAQARNEVDEEKALEEALLGKEDLAIPIPEKKPRPTIGQDSRRA